MKKLITIVGQVVCWVAILISFSYFLGAANYYFLSRKMLEFHPDLVAVKERKESFLLLAFLSLSVAINFSFLLRILKKRTQNQAAQATARKLAAPGR